MKYDREKLREIFEADSNKKLILPNFQRDFVWKIEEQKKLLASILVGLPIGSFLIIQGNRNDFSARQLCFTEVIEPKEECKFLLDGQQRLSCLKSIFDNLYNSGDLWEESWEKLYGKLRYRWYLKICPEESSEDIFGWEKLKFPNNLDSYDPDKVLEFIGCHRILLKVNNNTDWHHPAYKFCDESGKEVTGNAQKRNSLALKYSHKNLVPLFEIYSDRSEASLHSTSLRHIANKRREALKAEVRDGKWSIEDILGHLEPDISNVNDQDILNEHWFGLSSKWQTEVTKALEGLLEQEILETVLPSNEIARAASIFETINKGGMRLSNFDLIVAKTVGQNLVQSLKDYIEQEISIPSSVCGKDTGGWKMSNMKAIKDNSIARCVTDEFLHLISIICFQEGLNNKVDDITPEHIKQSNILKLESTQINNNFRRTIKSLRKAFAFLQYRCGIVEVNDIAYKLMLLPIAYIFSLNENNEDEINSTTNNSTTTDQNIKDVWNNEKLINKIEFWYWSSLFSGRYKEKQNERCIQDLQYLYHWVVNDDIDEDYLCSLRDNFFNKQEYSNFETLIGKNVDNLPQKAIKYAILQYILSQDPKDFILQESHQNPTTINKLKAWEIAKGNNKIEEHHIIPLSAASIGQSTKKIRSDKKHLLNSPLNLTYFSRKANRDISDLDPNIYLKRLTDATLTGHELSTNFINLLTSLSYKGEQNDYQSILQERFDTLKRTIKTELEKLIDSE